MFGQWNGNGRNDFFPENDDGGEAYGRDEYGEEFYPFVGPQEPNGAGLPVGPVTPAYPPKPTYTVPPAQPPVGPVPITPSPQLTEPAPAVEPAPALAGLGIPGPALAALGVLALLFFVRR